MSRHEPTVLVVGAGMAGLACAVDLAASGVRVIVLERARAPGGKARTITIEDVEVDAGPTVLTMPWVFDELFETAGSSFRTEVPLARAAVLARHVWSDGTRLDLHADPNVSAEAIGDVFGAREARAYLAFCEDGRRIFEIAEKPFLRAQRPTLASIVKQFGALGLTALTKIDSHRTMARALEQRFEAPRLRQLFGRYATYCGSSPYDAPATLNLVAHVEAQGVYRVAGGLQGLGAALARLAVRLGVEIHYEADVERILVEGGRASGVLVGATRHAADAVVFNGDVSALGESLLGREVARAAVATPPDMRSLSAVTWAMLARAEGAPLLHHNVFFSDDYPAEFEAIFRRSRVPDAPTVYVCAQDRADHDAAPSSSRERFLVLVNAPATGDRPDNWSPANLERAKSVTNAVLQRANLVLEPSTAVATTPRDFHRLFPGTGGALYGPKAKGALSALSRHGATSKIPGLYLASGSVHPGPGVPMAALSGRLAAAQLREDLE